MKKIYVFNNGGSPGFMNGIAVGEDGVVIAGHLCSHEGYMKHDMGFTSDWKHDKYNEHFGEGNWELEWVPSDEVETHEGVQKAFELHQKLEEPVKEENMPKVRITTDD